MVTSAGSPSSVAGGTHERRNTERRNNNAATGASAAGMRAVTSQFFAFYFRAPIKAFVRSRIDYMGYARAINPRIQAGESWSWRLSSPGLLAHAVKEHGLGFIPNHVLPPLIANVAVGAVLYTAYLQSLAAIAEPSVVTSTRLYPPPSVGATFAAGTIAGSVQSLFAAPLDALQVRFNTNEMLEGRYKNVWQYARHKLVEIGPRGVFAGWGLSFVKDSIGYGLFFATFETIKSQAYYEFLTRYYATYQPALAVEPVDSDHRNGTSPRRTIRPHYTIEPAFILGAGIAASIAQQLVQHPLQAIQNIHFGRLESLDHAAKLEQPGTRMLRLYYRAYQKTFEQCRQQARRSGGWRRWLFKDLLRSTLRQVPSTSAGLVVFELVRRKYATDEDVVRIHKDGYDILLS